MSRFLSPALAILDITVKYLDTKTPNELRAVKVINTCHFNGHPIDRRSLLACSVDGSVIGLSVITINCLVIVLLSYSVFSSAGHSVTELIIYIVRSRLSVLSVYVC